MRKITLLFAVFMAFLSLSTFVQGATVYDFKDDFTTAPTEANWGFSSTGGGSFTYNSTNKLLEVRWGTRAHTTKDLDVVVTPGTDGKITIETILKYYTSGSSSNSGTLYFLDENGNAISGIYFGRMNVGGNKWAIARSTSYPGAVDPTANATYDNALAADAPTAKITFILDFETKTLSYSAQAGSFDYVTRVFTPGSVSVSVSDQAFINTDAANFKTFLSNYNRAGSASGSFGYDLMYVGVSTEQSVQLENVTVKFQDQDDVEFKAEEIVPEQVVGSLYSATLSQKASVKTSDYYYVLDSASPTSVEVATGGSTLILKFVKSSIVSGTYTWTGASSANWNESDKNFTTDAINSLGYQNGNGVAFTEASVENKAIVLVDDFDLGINDVTVSADDYSFSGVGRLAGTGRFVVNTSGTTTLGINNQLVGGVDVQQGTAHIKSANAGTKYTVADDATLILETGADFAASIEGTGSINIGMKSNNAYSPAITGASTINIQIEEAGRLASSTWTNNWSGGSFPSGAQINVTNNTGTESTGFAVSNATLTNNKIHLGDGVRLLRFYNQNNASTETGTVHYIGELSGEEGSFLESGFISGRAMTYIIGGLNTDATFNGTIKDYTAGSIFFVSKVGTGTWTLTGTSTYANGWFKVDAGKVVMNGSLEDAAVPVTVAAGATLEGTGSIAGNTTVNGNLAGSLSFGNNLILGAASTTNIKINGSDVEKVTVGETLTYGGNLVVELEGTLASGDYPIFEFKALAESAAFSSVTLPDDINWSFDAATGILTYVNPGTAISAPSVGKNILSKEYFDLTGKIVNSNYKGFAVEKITYSDGSVVVSKTFRK